MQSLAVAILVKSDSARNFKECGSKVVIMESTPVSRQATPSEGGGRCRAPRSRRALLAQTGV